jgi:hypothetical protein
MQNSYGDLRNVQRMAEKRDPVYQRQNPVSLQQNIAVTTRPSSGLSGLAGKALDIFTGGKIKALTEGDSLVDAARRRYIAQQGGQVPDNPAINLAPPGPTSGVRPNTPPYQPPAPPQPNVVVPNQPLLTAGAPTLAQPALPSSTQTSPNPKAPPTTNRAANRIDNLRPEQPTPLMDALRRNGYVASPNGGVSPRQLQLEGDVPNRPLFPPDHPLGEDSIFSRPPEATDDQTAPPLKKALNKTRTKVLKRALEIKDGK